MQHCKNQRVAFLRRENHKQGYLSMQAHIGESATSASGKRSFSTDRRLKTCFRSTMRQERFSNLTILNRYKEKPDRLSVVDIANEFYDRDRNRNIHFDIQ